MANLASKMTPKWSPKRSQSDEGRPSRNMRRRGWIACPPPPWSPVVASFSETGKRAPKSRHNPSDFEISGQNDPKRAPRGLPEGVLNVTKILLWGALGTCGTPRGHHCPQMTPKAIKITSTSNLIDPKMITNPPNVGRHFGRVQILLLTPKLKKRNARVPPCVS